MIKLGICVLTLLGTIFLSSCSSQSRNIDKSRVDMTGIRIALAGYAQYDGRYPTTEQGLQALVAKPNLPPVPRDWNGPYLETKALVDPWGNKYIYRSPSTTDPKKYKYDLYSYGPDGKESDDDVGGRSGQ